MLTVSREKRFLKEIVVKNGPQYKQYCRESLRELITYTCPGIGAKEGYIKYGIRSEFDKFESVYKYSILA